ncbi:hypothetical protein [Mannheimia massilioguelmaensis]|uniref:hypothetical protein n=1 Tax=Mannheimia massilioguelmaensis TaxID=1604354 RepID=UPI0005C97959|nr:hypothetical protein [Mannheimia massilioguelmaensis]
MSEVLYRYMAYDDPIHQDCGEDWSADGNEDIEDVICDIAKANYEDWELYDENEYINITIWVYGDFDNRKKFSVSPYYLMTFSATEL